MLLSPSGSFAFVRFPLAATVIRTRLEESLLRKRLTSTFSVAAVCQREAPFIEDSIERQNCKSNVFYSTLSPLPSFLSSPRVRVRVSERETASERGHQREGPPSRRARFLRE